MSDISAVLQQFDGLKKGSTPDDFFVRCPMHDDRTPSLHISRSPDGTIMFHCFSCEARFDDLLSVTPGLTMDMVSNGHSTWPTPVHHPPEPEPDPHGVTIESLAKYTKLPAESLLNHGLKQDGESVMVPYYDHNHQITARKFRVAIKGAGKYRFEKGSKVTCYGLNRRRGKTVVFVEGESDCWTLWHHNIPALGVPGASMSSKIRPRDVAGIVTAYVIQETGQAGAKFAHSCAMQLQKLGVEDVRIVDMGDRDDPSSIYKRNPETFRETMRTSFRASKTLSQVEAASLFKAASDAEGAKVAWLHTRYVPMGHLTILAGLPGSGKTTVAASYAASVSTGQPMPLDSMAMDPRQVLFMSREDGEGMIRARLEAAGAHLPNVQIMVENTELSFDEEGVRKLRAACEVFNPKLIVIDPVVDFMAEGSDMNHAQDVRGIVRPLMKMAHEFNLAILLLAHNSKKVMIGSAQDVVSGSRDWTASARSVMTLYPDPAQDKGSVLAQVKTNLGKVGRPIRFTLEDQMVSSGDYVASCKWGHTSNLDAEDIQMIMSTPQARVGLGEARDYLLDTLAHGSVGRKEVIAGARKIGIRQDHLRAAMKVVGVEETGFMLSIPYTDDQFEEVPV